MYGRTNIKPLLRGAGVVLRHALRINPPLHELPYPQTYWLGKSRSIRSQMLVEIIIQIVLRRRCNTSICI